MIKGRENKQVKEYDIKAIVDEFIENNNEPAETDDDMEVVDGGELREKSCFGIVSNFENKTKVYVCLHCGRYKIESSRPNECVCHNPMFVIDETKRIE